MGRCQDSVLSCLMTPRNFSWESQVCIYIYSPTSRSRLDKGVVGGLRVCLELVEYSRGV